MISREDNDAFVKYLIKHLAITMQQFKRNPSIALAYEIGRRQKGLDTWPLWNKTSVEYMLKIAVMNNATKRFIYRHMDKSIIE